MQLNSLYGKELLVQAGDQAALTDWADAIEKVISELAKQVCPVVKWPAISHHTFFTISYHNTQL